MPIESATRIKLTKRSVEGLAPASAPVLRYDDKLAGFAVRVMPSGRRYYFVRYRNKHGRSRWFTIGEHGKITVEVARMKAKEIFSAVADGGDPAGERKAFRKAATVNELLDRYIVEHIEKNNRPSTQASFKGIVEHDIRPAFGHLKVDEITRQEMDRFHRAKSATSPRQANLALAVCSKAFNLAELWGMRPDDSNPCKKIKRNPESHRERFLSADELERLGATLRQAESIGLPWRVGSESAHPVKPEDRRTVYRRVTTAAIELLLFTGCRLSEVLNLRWEQVDFDAGTIFLLETKAGRRQSVTMSAPARQVLKELETTKTGDWVLPSSSEAKSPISKAGIEASWAKIRTAARLEDVRMHDLRHTVGTYAGQSGANAFLVRDLLRHKSLAMTGRYVNRADDPVRTLNDLVSERIAAGLSGRKTAEVVPMKRGA